MRKILTILMLTLFSVVLFACRDKQITDDFVNVLFFTGVGGSKVETYFDVVIDSIIEEPEEPTKDGYRFSGWYQDVKYENEWIFETSEVKKSMVLYAKWYSMIWTINFNIDEEIGEKLNTQNPISEFEAGDNIYLPIVTRPGGTFRGWSLVPEEEYTLNMTLYSYSSHLPILEYDHFELYPIFNNNKYMVTFQPRNAEISVPKPVTGVEYGSVINWLPVIEDTATQRFRGWHSKNGVNTGDWGIEYTDGSLYLVAANSLLYAKWEDK